MFESGSCRIPKPLHGNVRENSGIIQFDREIQTFGSIKSKCFGASEDCSTTKYPFSFLWQAKIVYLFSIGFALIFNYFALILHCSLFNRKLCDIRFAIAGC